MKNSARQNTKTAATRATKAKPLLKWVGGKRQLLVQYDPFFPPSIQRYIEPFTGGGAVFFHLWNTDRLCGDFFLFDNNTELINVYNEAKNHPEELIELLSIHKSQHSPEYFYKIRGLDRQNTLLNPTQQAARTIYLNKTCYNGLYRVNSKGMFNAPIGSYKNPQIVHPEALRATSRALQQATIERRDFRSVVELAMPGDFIYLDPPYNPLSKTANFTGYTASSFTETDQRDLADVFKQLSDKKCKCMLSNSHTPFITELYKDFRIEMVFANRPINSVVRGRGRINEVLILNY